MALIAPLVMGVNCERMNAEWGFYSGSHSTTM
jgi:hypothetical protein